MTMGFRVTIIYDAARQPRVAQGNASGRASGKRTLGNVLEQEMASKKSKSDSFLLQSSVSSRFFRATESHGEISRRLSRSADDAFRSSEKENIPFASDALNSSMEVALEIDEPPDPVVQEDGYISPSPSYPRLDTPDLSSPVPIHGGPASGNQPMQDDFGVDAVSSPPVARHRSRHRRRARSGSLTPAIPSPCGSTPRPRASISSDADGIEGVGPDLRVFFGGDVEGDSGSCYGEFSDHPASPPQAVPSGLATPNDLGQVKFLSENGRIDLDVDLGLESEPADPGESERHALTLKNETVANGWRSKWAWHGKLKVSQVKGTRSV